MGESIAVLVLIALTAAAHTGTRLERQVGAWLVILGTGRRDFSLGAELAVGPRDFAREWGATASLSWIGWSAYVGVWRRSVSRQGTGDDRPH
jgi:hypothetical protein